MRELILSELKSTSAETRLGWLWWLLDPLILMCIYWAVVVGILGRGHHYQPYPLFVLCGLLPWNHIAGSSTRAVKVLAQRESLIRSVPFPTMALPLSLVLSRLVYLAIGLVILIVATALWKGQFSPVALMQVPLLLLLQMVLMCGVCLAISIYGVIVPDLGTALSYLLRIGFYACPIIYGLDLVESRLGRLAGQGVPWADAVMALYMLNPLAILVTGYRAAIFDGDFLGYAHWLILAIETIVVFIVGYGVYRHHDRRVIKFI